MSKVKVFVSQPMNGKTDEEILARRAELFEIAKKNVKGHFSTLEGEEITDNDIELIDSFFEDAPDEDVATKPVWYLGESIKKLAEADIAIFDGSWECARGCRLEKAVCNEYHINIIEA